MSDREWLIALKAGNKVLVEGSGLNSGHYLGIVVRRTKNFIVVKSLNFETKYRNDSGWSAGGETYYRTLLREATPEALIKYEEVRLRRIFENKLGQVLWNTVPLDKVKQIIELVDPYLKKKEEKKI